MTKKKTRSSNDADVAGAMIQTTVLLPVETIKELEQLVPIVAKRAEFRAMGRPTRSTVLRLALQIGVDHLRYEHEYGLEGEADRGTR